MKIMSENYTFKKFLSRNWWFLLLAFARIFNQSERDSAFGSLFLDILFFGGIILIIMFAYWFIRYGRKQNNYMKLFQKISLRKNMLGITSILTIAIIFFVYFFVYQPNQKQNDLAMELKCKEIAETRYQKTKEVNKKQSFEPTISIQYGFNGKLNTCIYIEESSWVEDGKLNFFFRVTDSVHDRVLLSGYNSDAYSKDVFRDHRKDGREIILDEYKKLRDGLLNETK